MTPPPALSLSRIAKRYGSPPDELIVLDQVSFDVRRGEIISVIGPSGCGKTTLFNIVGGLLGDYEGSIAVDGNGQSPRHRIGMVFQEESNFPWRTTLQNVAFPLEAAGINRRERLERLRTPALDASPFFSSESCFNIALATPTMKPFTRTRSTRAVCGITAFTSSTIRH